MFCAEYFLLIFECYKTDIKCRFRDAEVNFLLYFVTFGLFLFLYVTCVPLPLFLIYLLFVSWSKKTFRLQILAGKGGKFS